jgi:hypothetical protein
MAVAFLSLRKKCGHEYFRVKASVASASLIHAVSLYSIFYDLIPFISACRPESGQTFKSLLVFRQGPELAHVQ